MDQPIRSDRPPAWIFRHSWLALFAAIGIVICLSIAFDWKGPPMCPGRTPKCRVCADLSTVHSALEEFAIGNGGRYPDSLRALVTPDERGDRYLDCNRIPRDPWSREYIYVREPLNVMTLGADGVPGGTGEDADIDY